MLKNNNNNKIIIIIIIIISKILRTVLCQKRVNDKDVAKHHTITRDLFLITTLLVWPRTKGFTCGKRIIDYNFGIDDSAKLKFGTHKELIVLNILKYKYCVNKSRDISRDHFAKNRKLLTNWWTV